MLGCMWWSECQWKISSASLGFAYFVSEYSHLFKSSHWWFCWTASTYPHPFCLCMCVSVCELRLSWRFSSDNLLLVIWVRLGRATDTIKYSHSSVKLTNSLPFPRSLLLHTGARCTAQLHSVFTPEKCLENTKRIQIKMANELHALCGLLFRSIESRSLMCSARTNSTVSFAVNSN